MKDLKQKVQNELKTWEIAKPPKTYTFDEYELKVAIGLIIEEHFKNEIAYIKNHFDTYWHFGKCNMIKLSNPDEAYSLLETIEVNIAETFNIQALEQIAKEVQNDT